MGTNLRVLESVRCLDCGDVYAKPSGGGTTAANPGCPHCGYVGWLPVSLAMPRDRFAAGRLQRRASRSG